MNDVKSVDLAGTATFRLGILGAMAADRFATEIEKYALKPKHVGMLTALGLRTAASQQELATMLRVVPSLVVALADHLEQLGAISRVRDTRDRRRQVLTLTDEGKRLLARCADIAKTLDGELLSQLSSRQRTALHEALSVLAEHIEPSLADR